MAVADHRRTLVVQKYTHRQQKKKNKNIPGNKVTPWQRFRNKTLHPSPTAAAVSSVSSTTSAASVLAAL